MSRAISRLLTFWNALRRRPRLEAEMDAELHFHMEAYAADLVRSGLSRSDAERQARIEFGGFDSVKEDCRQSLGLRLVDELTQDLRYAARSLRKSPAFTAAAVLSLALGIGANTVVYSFVDAVFLKPLPYREPDRLVDISQLNKNVMGCSLKELLDLRAQNRSLADLAAITVFSNGATLSSPVLDHAERVVASAVTANYFDVLGVRPVLGRAFLLNENQPGRNAVVVLSNRFWRTAMGADRSVAGKPILLDGREHLIAGILPPGRFDRDNTQVWIPLAFTPATLNRGTWFVALGRLKPGVSMSQANIDLKRMNVKARAWRDAHVRVDAHSLVLLMSGAVAFVLLIACANVANLMLARAASRQREVAIRLATGAGRFRLVRQFLTESTVIAIAGGAVGALLAFSLMPGVMHIVPADFLPPEAKPLVDVRVLLFTLGASLVTGLLFGMTPAWTFSRSPSSRLVEQALSNRLRGALLIAETALAVILAAGAGLMVHSFARLVSVDPGFRPERILTWSTSLNPARYATVPRILAYQEEVLDKVHLIPGIEAAAIGNLVPFGNGFFDAHVDILGPAPVRGGATVFAVTPEYLSTMGLSMRSGRWFTSADKAGSPLVAVVGTRFARKYFGGRSPIGRLILPPNFADTPVEIVGVVASVHYQGLERQTWDEIYLPAHQIAAREVLPRFVFSVRTQEEPAALIPTIRSIASAVDKEQPIFDIRVMEDLISDSIQLPRSRTILFACLGGLALLLAAVGVYGVLHYAIVQRTKEIGVRIALGAQGRDIIALVLRQCLRPVFAGLALGLAASLGLTQLLAKVLFEVQPRDPATLFQVAVTVSAAALLAGYLPARRAARIQPTVALRNE